MPLENDSKRSPRPYAIEARLSKTLFYSSKHGASLLHIRHLIILIVLKSSSIIILLGRGFSKELLLELFDDTF